MRTWIILGSILMLQCNLGCAQDGATSARVKNRLFFSEQERLIIDKVRDGKGKSLRVDDQPAIIEFNGYIESDKGSRHVWVNQKLLATRKPLGKNQSLMVENTDAQKFMLRPGQRSTTVSPAVLPARQQ